jgi:hypothetical protein
MNIIKHKLLTVQMTDSLTITEGQSIGVNTCDYFLSWDSFTNPEGRHFQHMDVWLVLMRGRRQAKINIGLLFELTLRPRLRNIREDADTSWEIVDLAMDTVADIFVLEAGDTSFAGVSPAGTGRCVTTGNVLTKMFEGGRDRLLWKI